MRVIARSLAVLGATILAAWTSQAKAETVVVYTNPMTLERTVVVTDRAGPDRAFHCFLPPSDLGCQPIAFRRRR
ncbi:MAG TPA: hypothetical protein VFO42_02970 [Sphingomicrobium sp.]|nr:hypothetical protein [Sphingomicrobium sp.]